jgi:hypothetical protein
METQIRLIAQLPILEWYLPPDSWTFPQFRHAHTHQLNNPSTSERHGVTLWTGDIDGQSIRFAWEWVEISPRVLVMATSKVHSNVLFICEQHETYLEPAASTVQHIRIVHSLPWQKRVLESIDGWSAAGVPAKPCTEANLHELATFSPAAVIIRD